MPSFQDLKLLEEEGIISSEQARRAQEFLSKNQEHKPRFDLIHFAYYFGALICITAMTWFMNLGWEKFGGPGLTFISLVYALLFTLTGLSLWKTNFKIPGGLLFTMAVCMTPLFVYGLQRWTGFWIDDGSGAYRDYHRWIKSSWVLMSTGTVFVGFAYLWKFRFPFLTMPIAVALWYLSMDMAEFIRDWITPATDDTWNYYSYSYSNDFKKWVSLWFGLAMILGSYFFDRRTKGDYSFWVYLFGLMAFWIALTSMDSSDELGKFIYFCINLGLLGSALFLNRSTFAVFGAMGTIVYLTHLSYKVFKDSMLFPVVLVVIGIGIIFVGVQIQKNKSRLDAWLNNVLPHWVAELRPQKRMS